MAISRLVYTVTRLGVMSVGLAVVGATMAEAQRTISGFPRSDQSDVTGPAVTSGDQLAPLFTEPGTVRSMACAVAWGVRTAADRTQGMLASATLAPRSSAAGQGIRTTAQRNVLTLLSASRDDRNAGRPVLSALVAGNTGASRQAQRLVSEAAGLYGVMETLDPVSPGRAAPTQLERVTGAYNAFIDASTDAFLASPPAELIALHAVLDEMVSASIENQGREGDVNLVDDAGLACAGFVPPVPSAPVVVPPADQPFERCVLTNGDFRIVAGLRTAEGDSVAVVDDARVPFGSVYPSADRTDTPHWVNSGEAVTIDGQQYRPFGVTRIVRPGDVFRGGYHQGHEYFTAPGEDADAEVIYFVSGTDCLVQPYRSVETIQVRG